MTMLSPFINQDLGATMWRLEIDSVTGIIFLEIRNGEDKKVSFTAVSLLSGAINFSGFTTPERWLTGMEAAYDGLLLLHNYQSANGPLHKGVIAVNIKGETAWSNYTYAFDQLTVNGPVLYNTQVQPKKLFLADIATGAMLRQYNPAIDIQLVTPIQLPEILTAEYINVALHVELYGNNVHYLEHNNFRIVSLHSFLAGELKQHLFIFNGDSLVYEDLLAGGIQKMQPESFIVYKNWLIYIKNKSVLKVINL